MRNSLREFVAMALLLALTTVAGGCASSSQQLVPVTRPNERLQAMGVSILPPAGEGWYVAERANGNVWNVMFQQSPTPEDAGKKIRVTTFITVEVERVDRASLDKKFPTDRAALEHVRNQFAAASTGRFQDQGSQTNWTTLQGAQCLRYSSSVEERQNPADPSAVLTIQTEHACCFHPRDRDIVMWIMVSRRYPNGTPVQRIDDLTGTFLRNISFDAPK